MTPRVTERERSAILSSLGAGVVPSIGLHHIQVGRKDEVEAMLEDLRRIAEGGAGIRFIVGRYGAGKSFFLNLIETVALERKFVVARADITTQRRLHGTGGQARSLYSELMRNLATRSRPEGGALSNLVEKWIADRAHEVKAGGGTDEQVAQRVHELCKPLQEMVSGYDFSTVLECYYRGFVEHNEQLQQAAIRWLRAEYTTKTEARQDLGVRTIIDDDSFYDYLKLMAAFVHIAGYSGLIVGIDEVVVLSHRLNNKIARNNNYEAVLRILNDTLQGSVQNLGFLFGATDDCVFDQRRGMYSYEALRTRLANNRFATDALVDLNGVLLKLGNLTPEDCFVLLHNVRRVHAKGNDGKAALPDDGIVKYLEDCNRRMGAAYFQTPRETVKDFVGLLSILEQNPEAKWEDVVGKITTSSVQTQDSAVLEAVEDNEEAPPAAVAKTDDDLVNFKL
ncbi:MAG TPA: ATP-binding protein [Phycisphaerae bacterium]|nr:ATP-binding protein [Phycisphaerae bacterium]